MATEANSPNSFRARRLEFRAWRRARPFWAGVFTALAGLLVLFPPYASLKFGDIAVTLNTLGGVSALVIGIVMLACAIAFWTRSEFRMTAGIVTLILSLVAIITANLGSLFIGTTLGLIGSALGIAWSPKAKDKDKKRKKGQQASDEPQAAEQTQEIAPVAEERLRVDELTRPTPYPRTEPAGQGSGE